MVLASAPVASFSAAGRPACRRGQGYLHAFFLKKLVDEAE